MPHIVSSSRIARSTLSSGYPARARRSRSNTGFAQLLSTLLAHAFFWSPPMPTSKSRSPHASTLRAMRRAFAPRQSAW